MLFLSSRIGISIEQEGIGPAPRWLLWFTSGGNVTTNPMVDIAVKSASQSLVTSVLEVLPGTAEPLLQEGWSSRRDEHCGRGDCKRALDD